MMCHKESMKGSTSFSPLYNKIQELRKGTFNRFVAYDIH